MCASAKMLAWRARHVHGPPRGLLRLPAALLPQAPLRRGGGLEAGAPGAGRPVLRLVPPLRLAARDDLPEAVRGHPRRPGAARLQALRRRAPPRARAPRPLLGLARLRRLRRGHPLGSLGGGGGRLRARVSGVSAAVLFRGHMAVDTRRPWIGPDPFRWTPRAPTEPMLDRWPRPLPEAAVCRRVERPHCNRPIAAYDAVRSTGGWALRDRLRALSLASTRGLGFLWCLLGMSKGQKTGVPRIAKGLLAWFAQAPVRLSCASGVSCHSALPATEGMERPRRVGPDVAPLLSLIFTFCRIGSGFGNLAAQRQI